MEENKNIITEETIEVSNKITKETIIKGAKWIGCSLAVIASYAFGYKNGAASVLKNINIEEAVETVIETVSE